MHEHPTDESTWPSLGTIYFTAEYALRLLLAHSASASELGLKADVELSAWRKTLRYAVQPLNVIDVLAIVPYYLDFIGIGGSGAAVLRVLRLVRIFRVLSLGRALKEKLRRSGSLRRCERAACCKLLEGRHQAESDVCDIM